MTWWMTCSAIMQCAVDAARGDPAQTTIIWHCSGGSYTKTPFERAAWDMESASHFAWDAPVAAAAARADVSLAWSHLPSVLWPLAPKCHAGAAVGKDRETFGERRVGTREGSGRG